MADSASPTLVNGQKVIAAVAMRDVPEGTKGNVMLSNGLSWIRYWVRFESGVTIGSINRRAIMTPNEWEHRHDVVTEVNGTDAGAGGDGDDAVAEGGGVSINGVMVPQKLIDRTKAARARLGV
jgi:hypothetical protein